MLFWGNIVNYKLFFVLLFGLLPGSSNAEQSVYLFSLDYLYPQKSFHQIESLSKELWSDLNLLLSDSDAQEKIMQDNETYIYEQVLKLSKAVDNLILNEAEARIYLTEDIQYLVAILECVESKHEQLAELLHTSLYKTISKTQALFNQAKNALIDLLESNQEIVP